MPALKAHTTLVGSLLVGLVVVAWPLSAAQTKAGYNKQNLIVAHNGAGQATSAPQWLALLLPSGYEPVIASNSGAVVLRDNNFYYRWKDGVLDQLEPYVQSEEVVPETINGPPGRVHIRETSALINNTGDIAIVWHETLDTTWHHTYNYSVYEEHDHIHIYADGAKTYRTFKPEGSDYHWIDGLTDASGHVEQIAYPRLDDDGVIYYNTLVSYSGPNGQDGEWIKFDPEGNKTLLDPHFTGASLSGVTIYNTSNFSIDGFNPSGLIDDLPVTFLPETVNDNGVVLGVNWDGVILWYPDGHTETLPANAIESLDFSLSDRNYPLGDLNGRKVAWVKKLDANGIPAIPTQYDPVDFVPLTSLTTLPDGWTTDQLVPPDTRAVQLGKATRGTETRAFLAIPFGPAIAVDANRDGTIKLASEDASDATSSAKPYRFWLNDDVDRKGVDSDEAEVEDDDNPARHSSDRDWMLNQIPCARDLEDFARLWIYTQGLNNAFKNGDMKLGLKWTNISRGAPALKIYRAADIDGGTGYLLDPTIAQKQIDLIGTDYGKAIAMTPEDGGAATTLIEGANGFIFPTEAFVNLTDSQPKTYLLIEGCKTGTGQLQLAIYDKNGTKIGDSPGIYLDLKNIKEMYERWTVGDGPTPFITSAGGGGAPAVSATISPVRLPSGVAPFQYGAKQTADDNTYILYVHGWNMHPWEKDAWAETAFKRLYWQGYRGRFGAFQWPTTYHDGILAAVIDYDKGEYSAWSSGLPLMRLLASLHGPDGYGVSVLAHSMGNVVTGEALRLAATTGLGQLVNTYVATQAAVPGHCYDFNVIADNPLPFIGGTGPTTANAYNNWLTPNSGGVGAKANFYNVNDFALNKWQLDQILKPDAVAGLPLSGPLTDQIGPPYGYTGIISAAPVENGFYKTTYHSDNPTGFGSVPTGHYTLHLGDPGSTSNGNIADRYEIFAFASEPRSLALGAIPSLTGFEAQNLQSLWPVDEFAPDDQPQNQYASHPWHSAQFRFANADQANYWNIFMRTLGLPTTR